MRDSDHQSTKSGAFVVSNDDLLTEILLGLPATSIIRFKSVSKHWRWLLSHRNFTMRYDHHSKSPGLFFTDEYVPFDVESEGTLSLGFYRHPCAIRILQSCNGLLLCCNSGFNKFYVINPTTNQFSIIPSIPEGQIYKIVYMGLVFHQTDCVHYKVLCIIRLHLHEKLFQIQIYSSDTRKWKISVKSFSADCYFFGTGVYWNGAFHFAPSYHNHYFFKLDDELLQLSPLPMGMVSSKFSTMYFGESRSHLHLIGGDYCQQHNSLRVNVYEMLSDYSGWFVKYQVDLDQLPIAFPKMIGSRGYKFDVVDVVRGEKEEDTFMVLNIPKNLITYNVHDKSFKQFHTLTEDF